MGRGEGLSLEEGSQWSKTPEHVGTGPQGAVTGWVGESSLLGPLPASLIQVSQDGSFVWLHGRCGLGLEVICLPPAAGCQLTSANQLHFHCH